MISFKLLLVASIIHCGLSAQPFPAHEYDRDLNTHQQNQAENLPLGKFAVIVHGQKGAGKSTLCNRLTSNNINAIDTVAFTTSSQDSRPACVAGLDFAADQAKTLGAPVRRIYFLIEPNAVVRQFTESILSHFKVLSLAYQLQSVNDIVLVVSKCDQRQMQREEYVELRQQLARIMKEFWGISSYRPESVLLISAMGSIRHLADDLQNAASNNHQITVPGPIMRSKWISFDPLQELFTLAQDLAITYSYNTDSFSKPDFSKLRDLMEAYNRLEKIDGLMKHIDDYFKDISKKSGHEKTAAVIVTTASTAGGVAIAAAGVFGAVFPLAGAVMITASALVAAGVGAGAGTDIASSVHGSYAVDALDALKKLKQKLDEVKKQGSIETLC